MSILKLVIFMIIFTSYSCSKKDSSSTSSSLITAQFIDAPVKGLNVIHQAAPTGDVTGNNGTFSCLEGTIVTFKLRNLEIGEGFCSSKIFLANLNFDVDDDKNAPITNDVDTVAAVLQSLSQADPDSGLIDLSHIASDADLSAINLMETDDVTLGTALTNFKTANAGTYQANVTRAAAKEHYLAYLGTLLNDLPEAYRDTLAAAAGGSIRMLGTKTSTSDSICSDHAWFDLNLRVVENAIGETVGFNAGVREINYASAETLESCYDNTDNCDDSVGYDFKNFITSLEVTFSEKNHITLFENPNQENYIFIAPKGLEAQYGSIVDIGDDETPKYLKNINNYFPAEVNALDQIKMTPSSDYSEMIGSISLDTSDLAVDDWVSETNYVFRNNPYKCFYNLEALGSPSL